MAKKEEALNYKAIVKELRDGGPQRLYLLWGPEDYLREQFLAEIKKLCLPEGEDDFSYKKLGGGELDPIVLRNAIDSPPFMTERTLVELRGADLNKIKDQQAEAVASVLSDIPDYCTVVLVQDSSFEPDGRLKLIKSIRKSCKDIKFTVQTQNALVDWVIRRFAGNGKTIDPLTAQHLIFVSGTLMNRLIPEIEKVAAYAPGDSVTRNDVETVAHHIPEARIFDMTDCIAARDTDGAMRILSELLGDKDNAPIMLLATIGMQMRRLYAAKLAMDRGLGKKYIEDSCGIKLGFIIDKLMKSARGFTLPQLRYGVETCCKADYAMKSSGRSGEEILKDVLIKIAAGEGNGTH